MKEKIMNAWKKWNYKHVFPLTTVLSILATACLALLVWTQISRFEEGMIDVCATQQDAYVQLVLDQINIKTNRGDEEIITEILSSLDASSNKYWTFSKNEAMLFVKDVLETNKYQGFTTSTYYISESAQVFLESLKLNKVTHKNIIIGEKKYVASGVVFEYDGSEYRLCLLTNRNVFLDNNKFLGAKINLYVLFTIVSFIFMISTMELARRINLMDGEAQVQGNTISYLNSSVNQLNDKLAERELYDTRSSIMSESMLMGFLEKMQEKQAKCATFARIEFDNPEVRNHFFEKAQIVLDHTVLRFRLVNNQYLLLFVKANINRTVDLLNALDMDGVVYDRIKEWNGKTDIILFYDEFMKR